MRPVPGGGKMRPNSAAREVRGVCVCEESAKSMLTFCERSVSSVWGDMSLANDFVVGAKKMTWLKLGTSSVLNSGVASFGERKVSL